MFWFDYALIRYTPNPKRGETINIGLIVFLKTGIDIRLLASAAKVRMFDGESSHYDIDKIKESLQTLTQHANNSEDRYQILNSFNGSLFLSSKGKFGLDELNQYDDKVDWLFSELVKPYSIKEKTVRSSRFTTQIKNKFSTLNLLAKDSSELSKHKIVQNYPISEKMGIHADFLLKNGVYHLSEVVDFNVNDAQHKQKETSLKIMTFMVSEKELSEQVKRYFVYQASTEREIEMMPHLNMAENYCDKMFNLSSKEEYKKYFALISELTQTEIPSYH